MNLDPSEEEAYLDKAVATLFARHGPSERLLDELAGSGYLDVVREAGPMAGVIVVERAADAQVIGPIGARVLTGPLVGHYDLPPAVGIIDAMTGSLCRWGPQCEAFFVLDGDAGRIASRDDVEMEPVESSFGATYGRVHVRRAEAICDGAGLRRAWQVTIAVEAEATMLAAIAKTVDHVAGRRQFGRPIGAFQAVQHRLASTYAMAMGTRWLARRAAWFHDDEFLTASAAAYACEAAQITYTNMHQVSGAVGITSEYGLVGWTTRLLGLRQELGGQRAHARRVTITRRGMPKPWPSPLPLP